MDAQTLGAAIAIAKSLSGSASAQLTEAAARAEVASAQAIEAAARAEAVGGISEAIEVFGDTGLTMQNGKICVKVERG